MEEEKIVMFICDLDSITAFAQLLSQRRPSDTLMAIVQDPGRVPMLRDHFSTQFRLSRSFYRMTQSRLNHHITFR